MRPTSREWWGLPKNQRELIEQHQTEAPVKMSELAIDLGLEVRAATLAPGISGEISPHPTGRFVIRVNRHEAKVRQRFTVAHEIAHFLLHKDHIGDGLKDDVLYRSNLTSSIEAEANRLAADILMPVPLVKKSIEMLNYLRHENPVIALSEMFQVSEAAMKIRLGLA